MLQSFIVPKMDMHYAEKQNSMITTDVANLGLIGPFDQENERVDFILNHKVLLLPFEILLQEKENISMSSSVAFPNLYHQYNIRLKKRKIVH